MEEPESTQIGTIVYKVIFSLTIILVGLGIVFFFEAKKQEILKIHFCDVGQGDGSFISTSGGVQILVDGGPGKKITECLSKYMPFWDRRVEVMLLTHPQQDHMEGQIDVFAKYKVGKVLWTGAENTSQVYSQWKKGFDTSGANKYEVRRGDKVVVGNLTLEILWPTVQEMDIFKNSKTEDLNNTSIIARLTVGGDGACVYFTGDIPFSILDLVIDRKCQVLKVAHHGSKTGSDEATIREASPSIAVIQVGAKNRYGHPSPNVVEMLKGEGTVVLRNDLQGDITISYDSQSKIFKFDK